MEAQVKGLLRRFEQTGRCRFNTLKGFFLQEVSDILYVKANGNYSDLFLKDGRVKLITHTLAVAEEVLKPYGFQRVGRSLMINLNYLDQVDRQSSECILVTDDHVVNLSLTHKHIKDLSGMF